jgi:hypothetical protein
MAQPWIGGFSRWGLALAIVEDLPAEYAVRNGELQRGRFPESVTSLFRDEILLAKPL